MSEMKELSADWRYAPGEWLEFVEIEEGTRGRLLGEIIEVWLYRIENRFHNRLNQFPVTFEGGKGTMAGGAKGGAGSMIVDEEWAN